MENTPPIEYLKRIIYTENVYKSIYEEISKRIGESTARVITGMEKDDFNRHPPRQSLDRIIVPITGLFGKRVMKNILQDALKKHVPEKDIERAIEILLS